MRFRLPPSFWSGGPLALALLFVGWSIYLIFDAKNEQARAEHFGTVVSRLHRLEQAIRDLEQCVPLGDEAPSETWTRPLSDVIAGCRSALAPFAAADRADAVLGGTLDRIESFLSRVPAIHADLHRAAPDSVERRRFEGAYRREMNRAIDDVKEAARLARLQRDALSDELAANWRLLSLVAIVACLLAGGAAILVQQHRREIVRRQRTEQELVVQKALLECQAEAVVDGLLVISRDGRSLSHNRRFAQLWKLPDNLAAGGAEPVLQWMAEQVTESGPFRAQVEKLTASPSAEGRDEVVLKTGRVFERFSAPVTSADGTHHGRIWSFREITEQKRSEAALRRQALIFENLHDGVILTSLDGRIIDWNPGAARIFGYSKEEVLGATPALLHRPEELRVRSPKIMEAVRTEGRWSGEVNFIRKDRTEGVCELLVVPLRDEQGEVVATIGVNRDITERKQAELVLRRQALTFENIFDGVVVTNLEGRIIDWNSGARRLFGYEKHEVLGRTPGFLHRTPGGKAQTPRMLSGTMREGRWSGELHFVRKDRSEGVCEAVVVPLRNDLGLVVATIGVYRDMTARLKAEEAQRAIERRLQDAQKMESLGVLAGGVAHDFNNLLTAVLGHAQLARLALPPQAPTQNSLEQIEIAARRAADLSQQMLAYSGRGKIIVRRVELTQLVFEMSQLLKVSVGKQAELVCKLTPNLPAIEADPTQLRQVIMNLIVNASEALAGKAGRIIVATGTLGADRTVLLRSYLGEDLPEGEYVFLEVTDTGRGMDAATKARIFEPFFTTKFTGRGLGLAAVLGIVRGHNGALEVDSAPGKGARFRVLFPAAQGPAPAEVQPAPAPVLGQCKGTVLVVDDEESVRTVAAEMLGKAGLTVLTAVDGQDGVDTFRARADEIDCVLLDVTMPKLPGLEAAQEIRRLRPDARIVLMSGFSEDDASRRFASLGLAGFLQKPYTLESLREKVLDGLCAAEA